MGALGLSVGALLMWDFGTALTFLFRAAVAAVLALIVLAYLAGKYL